MPRIFADEACLLIRLVDKTRRELWRIRFQHDFVANDSVSTGKDKIIGHKIIEADMRTALDVKEPDKHGSLKFGSLGAVHRVPLGSRLTPSAPPNPTAAPSGHRRRLPSPAFC